MHEHTLFWLFAAVTVVVAPVLGLVETYVCRPAGPHQAVWTGLWMLAVLAAVVAVAAFVRSSGW